MICLGDFLQNTMRVRETGEAMNEVEFSGVDGCGASMLGAWEFIKLFSQLFWVLKILHNKSFKNEHMGIYPY